MLEDLRSGLPVGHDVDVLLRDGSAARIRPICAEDAALVADFHGRLSPESVRLRFFIPHPELSEEEIRRLVDHCDPDHMALVAERSGALIAIAQYDRLPGEEEAEVAFLVDDAFHRRGLGTLLLEHLAGIARENGIRRFVAETLWENRAMLDVFLHAGFAPQLTHDRGEVRVVLDIASPLGAIAAAEERDRVSVVQSVARLLRPSSIAVVGAGRSAGTVGHEIVHNLIESGFNGPIYPVNPNARSVLGVPSWASVDALPYGVDLAVIAVPAESVVSVVEACGRRCVGGLVVVSAGFAETGDGGAEAQREVVRLAHAYGMRLIGPNCFGVINTDPSVSMNATFSADLPERGSVGFGSQSGGLGIAILGEAARRGIGLSEFVSMGNKGDVSGNDLLTWWEQDEATDVILLYLESFGNPRKFNRIARRVSRSKPIVAVKAGRTGAGARAASSHTAALASEDRVVDALFLQTGVIRVDTIEELFDVSEVLAHQPVPRGGRVAIVSNAGGPGVLAADAAIAGGLSVPELSADLQARLRGYCPQAASVSNPLDLLASASGGDFRQSIGAVLESGEIDAVVTIFTPPLVTTPEDFATGVAAAVDGVTGEGAEVPVIAAVLGAPDSTDPLRSAVRPVPRFVYPETAVRALSAAARYGRWRRRLEGVPPVLEGLDPNGARREVVAHAAPGPEGDGWLSGSSALGLLRTYGVPVVPSVFVSDAHGAEEEAERLGYPVALKVEAPGVLHKSDVGGVRLGLSTPAEVRVAFEAMLRSIPAMVGAIVQPMVAPGVETIAGFVRDPSFGAAVLFGLGGTTAELLGDREVRLAPLTDLDVHEMVLGIRAAPLLTGFRGSAPLDVAAVEDLVAKVGRLADDLPELVEVDCNPVMVGATGPVVLDARIRVRARSATSPPEARRPG